MRTALFFIASAVACVAAEPRAVNMSTQLDLANSPAIAGFVVAGDKPVRVLVRVGGPSLKRFGISGVVEDPTFDVLGEGAVGAVHDNWESGGQELTETMASAGAFSFLPGAKDAAGVFIVQPGAITIAVRANPVEGRDRGRVIVELYVLPDESPAP